MRYKRYGIREKRLSSFAKAQNSKNFACRRALKINILAENPKNPK